MKKQKKNVEFDFFKPYYIVNYDDNEVYITKGYDGKYKLSEMM